MKGLNLATSCTQLGRRPIGITEAERKRSGNVVSSPTERVVSAFLVFNATNREIPDQAIPNKAAKTKSVIIPKMPAAT